MIQPASAFYLDFPKLLATCWNLSIRKLSRQSYLLWSDGGLLPPQTCTPHKIILKILNKNLSQLLNSLLSSNFLWLTNKLFFIDNGVCYICKQLLYFVFDSFFNIFDYINILQNIYNSLNCSSFSVKENLVPNLDELYAKNEEKKMELAAVEEKIVCN